MKSLNFIAAITLLLAVGCATDPEGKNLVDGTVKKRSSGYQPKEQDDRLPHQKRMDDQIVYPWR